MSIFFNMGNMRRRVLMSYESACKNGTDTDHNQNGLHDSFPIRQKYSIYLSSVLITVLKASINLYLPPGLSLTIPTFALSEYLGVRYDPYTNIHLFLFKFHRLLYLMGSNCVLRQVMTFYIQGRCQSENDQFSVRKIGSFYLPINTTDLIPRNLTIFRICHSDKIVSEYKGEKIEHL